MNIALSLSPVFSVPGEDQEGELVALNAGMDGVIYWVFALNPLDYYTASSPNEARFPKVTPDKSQRYRVFATAGPDCLFRCLIEDELNIHDVQPLGDELLLVCSRTCCRGPGDHDLNGRVYNREGVFQRAMLLGDGIESVQVTSSGRIWTSYFDEGVFGNFGWDQPVGASGLVAWSPEGMKVFEYDPVGREDCISDCYALNVATNDDVWFYCYTEFPLVHLHQDKTAAIWNIPVEGSHAFAVSGDLVLFAGGYDDRNRVTLVGLQDRGKAVKLADFDPRDENGTALVVERSFGRAGWLYFLSKMRLYQMSVWEAGGRAKRSGKPSFTS